MSQLSIPTLTLFNRSPKKQRTSSQQLPVVSDNSVYDILKRTDGIQKQVYLPAAVPTSDELARLRRCQMQLDYLNAYKNALRRQELIYLETQEVPTPYMSAPSYNSHQSTQRQESLHSFRAKKSHKQCGCQQYPEKLLAKNAYLNSQLPKPTPSLPSKGEAGVVINKSPYLARLPATNNQKIQLQEEKPIVIDKSIMINDSLKGPVTEVQIQTDEPNLARSSFLISTVIHKEPQIMNQKNFRRKINGLQDQLNILRIDPSSDDIIIDLKSLELSKEQYMEESHELLGKLNRLSQGKPISGDKQQSNGSLLWPEGV